jgi:class 3 adenylate cyclase
VERGEVQIHKGAVITTRKAGELIGEAAFYRTSDTGSTANVRGAAILVPREATLFRVDRKFIADLDQRQQAVWHETVARVLTTKLDEATETREKLKHDRKDVELLLSRFVTPEGRSAARAALAGGGLKRQLDVEACDAVVWFSDIAGFSTFASGRSPEESSRIIRTIMDLQVQAIFSAKGEVDKFMGDGVMAFWRAPDQERMAIAADGAVRAALECEERLDEFFKANALPLGIRIGIHAGPVILGDFGGGERIAFTLIGETVNSAARYEQAKSCVAGKPLGPIRVSPAVFDLVDDPTVRDSFEARLREFTAKHGCPFNAFVSIPKEAL